MKKIFKNMEKKSRVKAFSTAKLFFIERIMNVYKLDYDFSL